MEWFDFVLPAARKSRSLIRGLGISCGVFVVLLVVKDLREIGSIRRAKSAFGLERVASSHRRLSPAVRMKHPSVSHTVPQFAASGLPPAAAFCVPEKNPPWSQSPLLLPVDRLPSSARHRSALSQYLDRNRARPASLRSSHVCRLVAR